MVFNTVIKAAVGGPSEGNPRMECLYKIVNEFPIHDHKVLENITAQIGDRRVAIISTCGKSRHGKTFWQNILLHALRYGEAIFSDDDIIGGQNGVAFKSGFDRDTVGILVWSEVFVRKLGGGEEVAVVLMDTQGTFDLQSENDESVNYFATSLLLSSYQIFNVSEKLDSTDFEALSTFIDYSEMSGQHLSQHFLFLIRNAIDGAGLSPDFLDKLLAGATGAPRLYKLITGCFEAFENVESYLVPAPDRKLVKADGEVRAGDCGAEFLSSICEAASHVLRGLKPKTAMGTPLNGPGFKLYAQEVFKQMESKGSNKIGNFYEAFKGMSLENAKTAGMAEFREAWDKEVTFTTFPPDVYEKKAKVILELAKQTYLSVPRYGQKKALSAHLHAFCAELEEKNRDKCASNKEIYKRECINGAVDAALHIYNKEIQPGFASVHHEGSRSEVQELHASAQKAALQFFEKEVALFFAESHTLIMHNKDKLVQLLEGKLDDLLRNNSQHWVQSRITELIDGRIEEFSLLLQEKSNSVEREEDVQLVLAECYETIEKGLEEEQSQMIDELVNEQPEIDPILVSSQIESIRERRLNRNLKAMESDFLRNTAATLQMKKIAESLERQKAEYEAKAQQRQDDIERKLAEAEILRKKNSDDERKMKLWEEEARQKEEAMKQQEAAFMASKAQFELEEEAAREELRKKEAARNRQLEEDAKRRQEESDKRAIEREEDKRLQAGLRVKLEEKISKLQKEKDRVRVQMENTEPSIGIDLGTTYSAVGICVGDEVVIIADQYGKNTMASQVAFCDGKVLVGEAAKLQATRNSGNTIYEAKRAMGRLYKDPALKKSLELWPFTVIEQAGEPAFEIDQNGKQIYTPVDISKLILAELKQRASEYLGKPISKAVITVPAYFNDAQRSATKDAAQKAGLEVLQLLNEPTAAAIAFGLAENSDKKRNILVYDFGGGTFDVSIMEIVGSEMVVKATCGNPHLGGEDINNVLLEYCMNDFGEKLQGRASARLRLACETAKITLSKEDQATIDVPSITEGKDYKKTIARDFYEELCKKLFENTLLPVEHALADAKLSASQIDEVVLVGGSSYIPKVRALLKEKLNFASLNTKINAEEAVVGGAALQAAKLTGNQFDRVKNISFSDVIPLTIGVGILFDRVVVLIPRNTAYPVKKNVVLTNSYDMQERAKIEIYEGESKTHSKNTSLGNFTIPLAPMLAGRAKISITYEIDKNGTLKTSAEDLATGKHGELTIERENFGKATIFDVEKYLMNKSEWKQT